MPRFTVPGAQLDYEISDEGGHPVVQLHGLTSSRSRDRLMGLDLGRGLNGTRLLRYDARAHGRSTGRTEPADYRWSVLAEDLLALLDAVFPGERVHGVGPSMGAGTLLHAALADPGRFSGLTLMLPPTAWETRVPQARRYRESAELVTAGGLAAFMAADRDVVPPPATVGRPPSPPDIPATLLPSALRGAALSDLPAPLLIATIGIPVTILAWTHDPGHPVSTAATLVEVLPHATLEVVSSPEGVSYWPGVLRDDVDRAGTRSLRQS
ncbi:alpha/beta hydrolase [Brevibacterium sp. 50QC2O2]|jgi:3-oxoadipate enol-lactonase|uniref:alpha/beta fold hydrolase n=1 Tax=Brevibacterium sp. 50QC2O2 TaxID=2968459 RepID=UPI00211C7795|nr:alpha/beta hydrolase [Brevibacterium sp. 50QC2O2]MCQ9387468.1 alpha/beta hydrolase [Brevibacterium sp. 50QC2O2]